MKVLCMGVTGLALLAGGLFVAMLEPFVWNVLGCLVGIGCGAVLCSSALARLVEPDELP